MRCSVELLKLPEAATIANLSTRTLRRAIHASERPLRHHRFGRAVRIERNDLDAWLRRHAAVPEVKSELLGRISSVARELVESFVAPPNASSGEDGTKSLVGRPRYRRANRTTLRNIARIVRPE